ncbi:hypothetical protein H632_c154p2, partial [Helicosporidium sp. ATCC 50920]
MERILRRPYLSGCSSGRYCLHCKDQKLKGGCCVNRNYNAANNIRSLTENLLSGEPTRGTSGDERGPLWLVAAAVVGLNVPFGMLLLGTPKPVAPLEPWNMHAYNAAVHGMPLEYSSGQATPTKYSPHEGFDTLPPGDDPRTTLGRHFPKPALHATGGQIAAWKRKRIVRKGLAMAEPTGSGGSGNPILDLLENLPGMGGSEALGGMDMSFLENLMGVRGEARLLPGYVSRIPSRDVWAVLDPNIQRMTQALSNDPTFLEMAREVQDKMLTGELAGLNLSDEDGEARAPARGGAEGAEGMDPARYMEAMQRMMANPDFVAAAETLGRDLMSRVADPETACMVELFSNPAHRDLLREEMEKLEEDEGLGPVLRSMREQGDEAMMEYMMNPETMASMGRRFQTLFTRPDVRERFRHILDAPQPGAEHEGDEGGEERRSRGDALD